MSWHLGGIEAELLDAVGTEDFLEGKLDRAGFVAGRRKWWGMLPSAVGDEGEGLLG